MPMFLLHSLLLHVRFSPFSLQFSTLLLFGYQVRSVVFSHNIADPRVIDGFFISLRVYLYSLFCVQHFMEHFKSIFVVILILKTTWRWGRGGWRHFFLFRFLSWSLAFFFFFFFMIFLLLQLIHASLLLFLPLFLSFILSLFLFLLLLLILKLFLS